MSFIEQAIASVSSTDWSSLLSADTLRQLPRRYVHSVMAEFERNPTHVLVETALIIIVLYVLLGTYSYNPRKLGFGSRGPVELTKKEVDELIEEWTPQPLYPSEGGDDTVGGRDGSGQRVLESGIGPLVKLRGYGDRWFVNAGAFDFLGLSSRTEVKRAASDALHHYGCGSCGPRGFYGTMDAHLDLESDLAEFFGTDEVISYSDGVSTIRSAIPAFSKRGDTIIADAAVNSTIRMGIELSRSKVEWFAHNDMVDLERVLRKVTGDAARRGDKATRHFIVVEGLYRDLGDLAPLARIVELKKAYKAYILLDESLSFGTLGATGRGLWEEAGVPLSDIEVYMGYLSTSLAAVGGFALGADLVADHQRLSGAGYCFSASAAPFIVRTAQQALSVMRDEPELLQTLRERSAQLADSLAEVEGLLPVSDRRSPVQHLRLDPALLSHVDADVEQQLLADIIRVAEEQGVLCVQTKNTPGAKYRAPSSIRVTVSAAHSEADVDAITAAIAAAAQAVLHSTSGPLADIKRAEEEEEAAAAASGGGGGSGKGGSPMRKRR